MKQSGFGIASCLTFAGGLVLAIGGWVIINGLGRPPRNHMDFGTAYQNLFIAGGLMLLIAIVEVVGLILGIIGLCQAARSKLAAKIGTVFNSLGLLISVALVVLLVFAAR